MAPKLLITLRRERRLKLFAVLTIILGGLTIMLWVDNMLSSFVLAFVVTYLVGPVVNFLERRGLSRTLAILIPFVGLGIVVGLGISWLTPLLSFQFASLESKLPQYQQDFVHLIANTETRFRGFFHFYNINVSTTINSWLLDKTTEFSSAVPSVISQSFTVLFLTPIFAFFMLQDGRHIARALLSMVPNNLFELALNLFHQINHQMGGFIRARFLEAAIVGLVVWVGLMAIDFPYATLLSVFAAVTNLIPYVGPIIGAVPAVLITLIADDQMITTSASFNLIIVTGVYFIAQLIDIVFIIPLVVAKIVNLHPVTVIVVIIIGAQLLGVLGMVISIPVASALKLTAIALYNHMLELRA